MDLATITRHDIDVVTAVPEIEQSTLDVELGPGEALPSRGRTGATWTTRGAGNRAAALGSATLAKKVQDNDGGNKRNNSPNNLVHWSRTTTVPFGIMIKSVTMTIISEVTTFCDNNSKVGWILLGILAFLFLVYMFMPCVFDCFSIDSICGLFKTLWGWLQKIYNFIFGSDCVEVNSECGCGSVESGDDCGCGGNGGGSGNSGSGNGGGGFDGTVRGQGNIVVNLPAVNVTVNGSGQDPNPPLPPIIIPPMSVPPIYPSGGGGCGGHSYNSGSGGGCLKNSGGACVSDYVDLCGKRYAITYMPGQIRVYDSSGNILQTISHNLDVLRSIRYENDRFVVEDAQSHEFAGVIVSGAINFTAYP